MSLHSYNLSFMQSYVLACLHSYILTFFLHSCIISRRARGQENIGDSKRWILFCLQAVDSKKIEIIMISSLSWPLKNVDSLTFFCILAFLHLYILTFLHSCILSKTFQSALTTGIHNPHLGGLACYLENRKQWQRRIWGGGHEGRSTLGILNVGFCFLFACRPLTEK